jgi:pimeloyl-ACP methyl ester carboxylesterase
VKLSGSGSIVEAASANECDAMIVLQTFVLVHGARHESWYWRRVAEALRAGGHLVFTPTLTGLGERTHLLHPSLTIADFATDVANVIELEELRDIILVGHSLGGGPVSVVADRMPERLKRLVILDALLLEDGQSAILRTEVPGPAANKSIP